MKIELLIIFTAFFQIFLAYNALAYLNYTYINLCEFLECEACFINTQKSDLESISLNFYASKIKNIYLENLMNFTNGKKNQDRYRNSTILGIITPIWNYCKFENRQAFPFFNKISKLPKITNFQKSQILKLIETSIIRS